MLQVCTVHADVAVGLSAWLKGICKQVYMDVNML